jgi:hypothetical protein
MPYPEGWRLEARRPNAGYNPSITLPNEAAYIRFTQKMNDLDRSMAIIGIISFLPFAIGGACLIIAKNQDKIISAAQALQDLFK